MEKQAITILQLYPKDMNIYGDNGNLQVITKRLKWYGYTPIVIEYNVGDTLPKKVDIVIGGGGQDSGQEKIHADLLKIGPQLQKWADQGVPMLMVCGLYQLFGHFFKTLAGKKLQGVGILDIETFGTNERLIGNIITQSAEFGDIIGYENHSGQTHLGANTLPLATVVKGAGNNSADGNEGARYKNVIGTYLHGSILPKNPQLADFLIRTAVEKKHGEFSPDLIDDLFADMAREIARNRPR
ncbi:MAG: Glutamine amidotransferase [Candidatus Saccharibacteria bacterium]|nr:putative cobyric acid synthase CobQ [Candidatus Saccharibacteria bacterium]MDB5180813.1 Glutamine amidotransferase [Candidatus Saccharibacteria bacterium]